MAEVHSPELVSGGIHAPFMSGNPPSGAAGGSLTGTYPNPGIAAGSGVSAWKAPVLGAKVEQTAAREAVETRTENFEGSARIRGGVTVKAGETLTAGETILTVAAGTRPKAVIEIAITTGKTTAATLSLSAAGVLTCSATLGAGVTIPLDGETWNLT